MEIISGSNEIETNNQELLNIYPNPAGREFSVKLPTGASVIEVYDQIGRIVFRTVLEPGTSLLNLDTARFPKGALWVRASDQQGKYWHATIILQ